MNISMDGPAGGGGGGEFPSSPPLPPSGSASDKEVMKLCARVLEYDLQF